MFTLPRLPYAESALAPVVSANALGFHYGKHHRAYVDNLNKAAAGTPFEDQPLERVIFETAGKADMTGIFNNAAQAWNHAFYWQSLKRGSGGRPTGMLARGLESDLGGYEKFREDFAAAAVSQFGSGWAWLVVDDGELAIMTTGNAEVPFTKGA